MKKIGICGHFGFGCELLNGQTIKTQNITDILAKEFGDEQILCVDTHGGWKKAVRLCVQTFQMFRECTNVVFLPAHHALFFFVPIFSFYNLFFQRSMHYIVIGGWLSQFLEKHRWLHRMLKKMTGIYVETAVLKKQLEEKGLENVKVMRNFKNSLPLDEKELVYTETEPYPLCTFSRVTKEKGIEDAVKAVILANEKLGKNVFRLDIYGAVENVYHPRWEELKKTFPEYIRYGGQIAADKSTDVIKDYYALLFPSCYPTEGFAGTLIDSMNAGVPVIASDWEYNREAVIPNRTGILVSPNDPEELAESLVQIALNTEWWNAMKTFSLEEVKKYEPDQVIGVLTENLT